MSEQRPERIFINPKQKYDEFFRGRYLEPNRRYEEYIRADIAKAEKAELIECLGMLMRSMLVHPDCTEGSEFDDFTSRANELLANNKQEGS